MQHTGFLFFQFSSTDCIARLASVLCSLVWFSSVFVIFRRWMRSCGTVMMVLLPEHWLCSILQCTYFEVRSICGLVYVCYHPIHSGPRVTSGIPVHAVCLAHQPLFVQVKQEEEQLHSFVLSPVLIFERAAS